MKPVPVDVVTGFLGAGKTTLLTHVLGGALAGERVAVVVNELGAVSIDGRVIERLENVESMIELDNGCVCCTIDDFRFDAAVHELIERADPTLIVLETTGAADPSAVCERIARAGLPLDAVVTVVDAANATRALRTTTVARAQVRAADFLLVNKTDLVSASALVRLRLRLARHNRRALVLECERGRAPAEVLFATAARRYRGGARGGVGGEAGSAAGSHPAGTRRAPAPASALPQHVADERIAAFTWTTEMSLDRTRFERLLARLPSHIYRAKGLVRFDGAGWPCLFSYTCGRYELNWIQLKATPVVSQAVFIGRDVERARSRLLRELAACQTE